MKAMKATTAAKVMKAMKAPNVMKAMKAMKAMKKISVRLSKRHVFAGKAATTKSGLTKDKLVKNKRGRVVSKARSALGQKRPWIAACVAARKAINIKGFCAIKKGTPLYIKAMYGVVIVRECDGVPCEVDSYYELRRRCPVDWRGPLGLRDWVFHVPLVEKMVRGVIMPCRGDKEPWYEPWRHHVERWDGAVRGGTEPWYEPWRHHAMPGG